MSRNQIWIENTTSKYHHGVRGWEFGTCVWRPSLDRGALPRRYEIMRQVKPGDCLINCYDGVVRGTSKVAGDCFTTKNGPPNAGPWSHATSFHRFNLEHFPAIPRPVRPRQLIDQYAEEVRQGIGQNHPS